MEDEIYKAKLNKYSEILKVLGHPARLCIVCRLMKRTAMCQNAKLPGFATVNCIPASCSVKISGYCSRQEKWRRNDILYCR